MSWQTSLEDSRTHFSQLDSIRLHRTRARISPRPWPDGIFNAGDEEALEGLELCARLEGTIPARKARKQFFRRCVSRRVTRDDAIIINLSGRGDKDVQLVADLEAHRH